MIPAQVQQCDFNKFHTADNLVNARFLVRHGQCISNLTWPIDGYTDEIDVLTELGVQQAENLCRYFERFEVHYQVISSPLTRARQTADIICGKLPRTTLHPFDQRLIEKNHEEPLDIFCARLNSFMQGPWCSPGPWILVVHGHLIETLLNEFMRAEYTLVERQDGTRGLPGVWGAANGSVSSIIGDKFVTFNHVP